MVLIGRYFIADKFLGVIGYQRLLILIRYP